MTDGLIFEVDTTRVLRVLAREIYDSPLAMLRENLQNAYDAVRMRFARDGVLAEGGHIEIEIRDGTVSITDNGIGMTEDVLSTHFWKAGSSGKHSEAARQAGVVGTFGIGAMANFGVCTRLVVETRTEGAAEMLRSAADRATLKIGERCIVLDRLPRSRDTGTTVTATLDAENLLTTEQAIGYLGPFVNLLRVPVTVNGVLISQRTAEAVLPIGHRTFADAGTRDESDGSCAGSFEVRVDANGQVLVYGRSLLLAGAPVDGEIVLLQSGGQVNGLRSNFGLAPVPASGPFQFGGIANLSFLQPTAGREALSRESIDQVARFIRLAERAASEVLATHKLADRNTAFVQWLHANRRPDLVGRITVRVLPEDTDVPLSELLSHIGSRKAHYYLGLDTTILNTFANEELCLVLPAQSNPRRTVQLEYLRTQLKLEQVPDSARVVRRYDGADLSIPEVAVLIRATSVLREDYLIPEAEFALADISHGVSVLPERTSDGLRIYLSRGGPQIRPLLECYDTAYDVFHPVVKDFVRVHIYPSVQQHVPSSTRQGVDALRKILQRNRELYRYEADERGDLEGVLGDYLAGAVPLKELMLAARTSVRRQSQSVSSRQVGTVENVIPDVVASPVKQEAPPGGEFGPAPPIVRDDLSSDMKLLTTAASYPQLNNFSMLLGLSDRAMKEYSDFFRIPHTTRIVWGGHRVIYIFTDTSGRLSVYYDIQLREPIAGSGAGGGPVPTTTLITRRRIFVPVPDALTENFRVTSGAKEFFVRFDALGGES